MTRRSSTLKKQALLHERNVLKLVTTQKETDRLMSVISATEQSKYNELKFIYPPGTSPFKAPSDVALQESLENDYVLSFTIPKGTSRRNAMNISHHASNTFIRKVTLQAQNAHLASVNTLSSKQVFHKNLRPQDKECLQCGILALDVALHLDTLQQKAHPV